MESRGRVTTPTLKRGDGLWCLAPQSTVVQLYHGSQLYSWWNVAMEYVSVVCMYIIYHFTYYNNTHLNRPIATPATSTYYLLYIYLPEMFQLVMKIKEKSVKFFLMMNILHKIFKLRLGVWCLTPLSTIFQLSRAVLFVDESGVPGENHRPVASH